MLKCYFYNLSYKLVVRVSWGDVSDCSEIVSPRQKVTPGCCKLVHRDLVVKHWSDQDNVHMGGMSICELCLWAAITVPAKTD